MKNIVGYFIAGLFGTLAGSAYVMLSFAPHPFETSSVDLGFLSLNQRTIVLVPITNAHPIRPLTLTNISTSCGCASISHTRLEVLPKSIGWLPVHVLPKPPDSLLSFSVSAVANGDKLTRIVMEGRINVPFEGYPTHIVSRADARGRLIAVRADAFPVDQIALYNRSTATSLVAHWDPVRSEVFCAECGPDEELDLVIWSRNHPDPAWSGPVTLDPHVESN